MFELITVFTAALAFIIVAATMPWFIRKMREKKLVAKDMHKPGTPEIANNGGVLVLFVVFALIITIPIIFRLVNRLANQELFTRDPMEIDTALLLIMLLYAFYGVLDDYIDVGRISKTLIPLLFSYPLILVLTSWNPWIPGVGIIQINNYYVDLPWGGQLTGSLFVKYIIAPVFIMVVANLKNMHSGFNGLQTGCAFIIMVTVFLKAGYEGQIDGMLTTAALVGATLAFLLYNSFPARIFEGNIGSLAIGGTLGAIVISQHYIWAGFVMLLPHTFNFMLYAYWRIQMWRKPGDPRYASAKFARVREDGTIEPPNPYTLKWILPYHFKMTERQATYAMYVVTGIFCVMGFFIPG
jgi:UDP-N-acetylglucosamine--dolichyl-phosphate N-acetylglucosaminephosphotransferase